jgi:microsomal dipeptidase-like Zn-dependent dipeptidase
VAGDAEPGGHLTPVLVDLHAHFPMHLLPDEQQRTHDHVHSFARLLRRARFIDLVSRMFNYQGPGGTPSVTDCLMRDGDVGVVLSVLYAPLDEMDLDQSYGAPPRGSYFSDILAELQTVEDHVSAHSSVLAIARTPAELAALDGDTRPVLIHAIEGGFQLGRDEAEVAENVKTLAARGVAYVTLAHLFWRKVATNAPALPFMPDWLYHLIFPQPHEGLTPLGRAAVRAMVEHGILIDITHMSERAINDTFELLDGGDPDKSVPLIATHMACRFGKLKYSFSNDTIKRIGDRGGVLGLIFCEHYITDGLPRSVRSYEDSVEALCAHIDRIREVTGSFDRVAIGSDLDGYIKPALPGLEHMGHMRRLQQSLSDRYGATEAEKICSKNALRVLTSAWGAAPPAGWS